MLKWLVFFFTFFHAAAAFSQNNPADPEIISALSILNKARKDAGLDTVLLSASMSTGCYNHARYLVINRNSPLVDGLAAHDENDRLQGSTKEGAIAGKSSVIHYVKPVNAINGWLATFYHRIPLLQPALKEVGIAYYEKDYAVVSLINCITGTTGENTKDIVLYPNDGQLNVPVEMGPEIPHPVGQQGYYGFPVTIYFTSYQLIQNVVFKLSDKNKKPVKCHLSTPENPATTFMQWNTICAIPEQPLLPQNNYFVEMSCTVDGVPYKKSYSFSTTD